MTANRSEVADGPRPRLATQLPWWLSPALGVDASPRRRRRLALRTGALLLAVGVLALAMLALWEEVNTYAGRSPETGRKVLTAICLSEGLVATMGSAALGSAAALTPVRGALTDAMLTPIPRWQVAIVAAIAAVLPADAATVLIAAALLAVSAVTGWANPLAVAQAHLVLLATVSAIGAASLAVRLSGRHRALGIAAAWACVVLLIGGPILVGPAIAAAPNPHPFILPVLAANPPVAIATCLDLDLLRTDRIYQLTPIPAYQFGYPSPLVTLGVYSIAFVMLLALCCRALNRAEGG